MKRLYSTVVAALSLLALFISSAACVALPASQTTAASTVAMQMPHMAGSSDHECCPSHASALHSTVSCCTVHHQPSAIADDTTGGSAHAIVDAALPVVVMNTAMVAPPANRKTGPPPRRPAHNLRI